MVAFCPADSSIILLPSRFYSGIGIAKHSFDANTYVVRILWTRMEMSRILMTLFFLLLSVFFVHAAERTRVSAAGETTLCTDCGLEPIVGRAVDAPPQIGSRQEKKPVNDNAFVTCVGCEQQPCSATFETWSKLWGKWFGSSSTKKPYK